jgi:hypothetical protein
MTLNVITLCIEWHYAVHHTSFIVMLTVIMLSIMLSVVTLSVILLNVLMLNVVAPISGVDLKINQLLL